MEIAIILALLLLAIILFSTEFLTFDVVALLILTVLLTTKLLRPEDAFAGFGSDTIITIGGLFVMTAALLRTGTMERLGRLIQRVAGTSNFALMISIMLAASVVSAFISNTAATAFFLPAVVALSRRANLSPSKLLMPLAFASILTSSVTLISTSTNIVISGLLPKYKMEPMAMFELTPVGIPITIVGLLYMFTLGRRLLPERAEQKDLRDVYQLRDYLTEVLVLPNSRLAGKTLAQSRLGSEMDLLIVGLIRDEQHMAAPRPDLQIEAGDILLVEGRADQIMAIKDTAGIEIRADFDLPQDPFETKDVKLVEAMVMPQSDLRGSTLKEIRFRERFRLTVLAINRHEVTFRTKLTGIRLKVGDILLLQGSRERMKAMMDVGHLTLLGEIEHEPLRSGKSKYAMAIFLLTVALGTFKILPFAPAIVLGTLLMLLTGCVTPQEAYNSIEWRILILIGCMIAFGTAMEQSGAARFLSQHMVDFVGRYGPNAVLAGFFVLTVLLTQPMSNQAAALVLLPIAIQTANHMGLNPRTFAMMIAVAASCSYLTPLEPSCVLVYGPGRYKFMDFFKVGAVLTLLIFILALVLVPHFWPLNSH